MKVGDEVYLKGNKKLKGLIYDYSGLQFGVAWTESIGGRYYESELMLASEVDKEDQMMDWEKVTVTHVDGKEPKGHPNAAILMDIAKEAAINEEYWKEFEWFGKATPKWIGFAGESDFLQSVSRCTHKIRRKPRTIRIGNYDVPEPKAFGQMHSGFHKVQLEFDSAEHAELMVNALKELAGKQ